MTLVVNKIDRLILELRIKPADAYYKIKHTIEEVNTVIRFAPLSYIMAVKNERTTTAGSTQTLRCVSALKMAMSRSRARTCTGASPCVLLRRCTQTHTVRECSPVRSNPES